LLPQAKIKGIAKELGSTSPSFMRGVTEEDGTGYIMLKISS
jgi:hypothetical protein